MVKTKFLVPGYAALMLVVLAAGLALPAGPTALDAAVMDRVAGLRSDGLTPVVSVLSDLFSPVLVPVWALGAAAVLLVWDRRVARAVTVLGAVVDAAAVAEVIKLVIGRPRPPAVDQVGSYEATLSYPSGHVTGTAALLVGLALVTTVARAVSVRVLALVAALAVTVIVAWTRLYLGAHWATDVTAGLVVGVASAVLAAALVPPVLGYIGQKAGNRLPPRAAEWLAPTAPTGRHAVA